MPVLPKSAQEEADKSGTWMGSTAGNGWSPSSVKVRTHEEELGQVGNPMVGGGNGEHSGIAHCCVPTGCPNYYAEPIYLNDLGDAVKVSRLFKHLWKHRFFLCVWK
jgi:hypothetical protein